MPCHVPATSAPSRRRRPSRAPDPPQVAATLDLRKPGEREAHDLLLRFSTGRWPLWRVLKIKRQDSTLFVAIAWLRSGPMDRYAVAELSLDQIAVCWRYVPSAAVARAELQKIESKQLTKPRRQRQKAIR